MNRILHTYLRLCLSHSKTLQHHRRVSCTLSSPWRFLLLRLIHGKFDGCRGIKYRRMTSNIPTTPYIYTHNNHIRRVFPLSHMEISGVRTLKVTKAEPSFIGEVLFKSTGIPRHFSTPDVLKSELLITRAFLAAHLMSPC